MTELRLSQLKDATQLMALDELVWNHSTTPAPVEWISREHYLHKCPPGSQLVAVQDQVICGYIGFNVPTMLDSNVHVYEINIAVHPHYQRQGIGRKLMDAMRELAAEYGKRKLSLRVLASNPKAIAFYKGCGFAEQGRLIDEFCVDGQYVDDILMWCPVGKGRSPVAGIRRLHPERVTVQH